MKIQLQTMAKKPFLVRVSPKALSNKTRDRLGLVPNQLPANPIQNYLSRKGGTFHG